MDVATGPDKQGTMWYLLPDDKGATTRFKDAPPAGRDPDPDYEPKAGEWFWWWFSGDSVWGRLQKRYDGIYEVNGQIRASLEYYKGKCLPATPPE